MNLVLFEPGDFDAPLALCDPRARHILTVLRRAPGDTFLAGVVNGPRGVATLRALDQVAATLTLDFLPTEVNPPPPPITLLVGLPRPQTARDILRDAVTLGVERIHFITTERTDPNYATASLWTSGEWRRHALAGAAQACDTGLPEITWHRSLTDYLASAPHPGGQDASLDWRSSLLRIALDNYEATASLFTTLLGAGPRPALALALGPERGWGAADRAALRAAAFTLCSLGERVLRLETAVVAALSLYHALPSEVCPPRPT